MSLPLISCILLPILFPVFDDDVVPCALPFAEGPKLSLSVLSVAYVVAVNFEVYTLSALTKKLRTLVAFLTRRCVCVCVCAGGKISRLAVVDLGTFLA